MVTVGAYLRTRLSTSYRWGGLTSGYGARHATRSPCRRPRVVGDKASQLESWAANEISCESVRAVGLRGSGIKSGKSRSGKRLFVNFRKSTQVRLGLDHGPLKELWARSRRSADRERDQLLQIVPSCRGDR